ncbi:MAG TPA: NmrA/HSCARG family protein [Candidatus Eremiobacteraceae bacterium]|nr:NmrA/HSCARG family protein [Candidatus Eremiobacteraceae bacterium]
MPRADQTIFVTGATGKQGGAAARHLLNKGYTVRALTRHPEKPAAHDLAAAGAQIVQGDLNDPSSYRSSLAGAHGVFSVQNFWESGYDGEVREGIALADEAKAAGVGHFVYSSVASAQRKTGLSHFESKWKIEEHIRAIGIPHTIIRPVFFMDNWQFFGLEYILAGTLSLPLNPGTKLQEIAVDDIGAFVALAFEQPDRWLGRELDIAGDNLAMSDVAATFGRVIGRPVQYVQMPWDQFQATAGEEYAKMLRWFEAVGYDADIAAVRREHPALLDFESFLSRAGWAMAKT